MSSLRSPYPAAPPWRNPSSIELALPLEDLGRQLTAVFASHRPLHALHDGRDRAPVILELLGAVLNANACALADVFVVGALVGILEPAPAAHVIDQDHLEVGAPRLDDVDQLL